MFQQRLKLAGEQRCRADRIFSGSTHQEDYRIREDRLRRGGHNRNSDGQPPGIGSIRILRHVDGAAPRNPFEIRQSAWRERMPGAFEAGVCGACARARFGVLNEQSNAMTAAALILGMDHLFAFAWAQG